MCGEVLQETNCSEYKMNWENVTAKLATATAQIAELKRQLQDATQQVTTSPHDNCVNVTSTSP